MHLWSGLLQGCDQVRIGRAGQQHHVGDAERREVDATKRAMLLAARRRIVPVVHGLLGRDSLTSFAELSETDLVLTDPLADPDLVEALRAAGTQVVVADWADG